MSLKEAISDYQKYKHEEYKRTFPEWNPEFVRRAKAKEGFQQKISEAFDIASDADLDISWVIAELQSDFYFIQQVYEHSLKAEADALAA
jgi:hypothetical protein